jgi:hypothetical protein
LPSPSPHPSPRPPSTLMAEEPPAASSLKGLHSAATRRLTTFMTGEHIFSPQYSTFFCLSFSSTTTTLHSHPHFRS